MNSNDIIEQFEGLTKHWYTWFGILDNIHM